MLKEGAEKEYERKNFPNDNGGNRSIVLRFCRVCLYIAWNCADNKDFGEAPIIW